MLIAGEEVTAAEAFETFDPSTGEAIGEVARATEAEVDRAVASARKTHEEVWRETTPRERSTVLFAVAQRIREAAAELAETSALNGGVALPSALGDVEAAARYFEFYAGAVDKIGGESIPLGPDYVDFTVREPWGVCGVITPFNAPYQLPSRSVSAALAAGNTAVVKASEQAPLPTLRLGRLLLEAGLPPGAVDVVTGFGQDAGARLAGHPGVDHLTFTGSAATATRVMALAAAELTPTTVELGGKSPQIVFADADIAETAQTIVRTIVWSAGQACSAGTRVLVEQPVHRELVEALAAATAEVTVGPALEGPDMGPVITRRQQQAILAAIAAARESGAGRLVTGGGAPAEPSLDGGYFVEPTIFDDVDPASPLAREEVFGPVLAVTPVRDEAHALQLANDGEFGLVAGIWTSDVGRAHRLGSRIRAGQVYVNCYGVGGGVELPFGGYGKSGYGREKGVAGLLEYTQLKNVCVKIGPR
jgi:aldehyde dehydrogenase (NAD+)